MKFGLIFLSLTLLGSLSFAQSNSEQLKREIQRTADRLADSAPSSLASDRDLQKAFDLVRSALNLVRGNGGGGGGQIPSKDIFKCVSRDNDGQNPYALAKKYNGVQEKVLKELVFGTKADCDAKVSKAILWQSNLLICSSKDRDGQNPYSLYVVDQAGNVIDNKLVGGPSANCDQMTASAKINIDYVTTCTSRDGDGQNPWIQIAIDRNGSVSKGSSSYNSLNECLRNL